MQFCYPYLRTRTRCHSHLKLLWALLILVSTITLVIKRMSPYDLRTENCTMIASLRQNRLILDRPHSRSSYESPRQSSKNKTVSLHPDVNVVPSTLPETFVLPYQDCIPLPSSPKRGVVICVHPVKDDIWVSSVLKSGTLWEEDIVMNIQHYLKNFPDMVFVDIGSNIGEYTLFVAALGHKALAVEMLPKNVQHIQTALRISGLGSEVTIINNALYSDHRVLKAKLEKGNIGGTSLGNKTLVKGAANDNGTVYVHTICMDDLIPLLEGAMVYVKIDIENSEHHALRGAHKFFQKVNVSVVQMEWLNRGKEEGLEILQFMDSSGYVLSSTLNQYTAPYDLNSLNSLLDVFFLKRTNLST